MKTELCCISDSDIQVQRVDDERAAHIIMTKKRKGTDLSDADKSHLDTLPESSHKQASQKCYYLLTKKAEGAEQ